MVTMNRMTVYSCLIVLCIAISTVTCFSPSAVVLVHRSHSHTSHCQTRLQLSDGWSDFEDDDDEDDDLYSNENEPKPPPLPIDEDTAPQVFWNGEPLFVPEGSEVPLEEETVEAVLAACRMEIGTLFGYTEENRAVRITGGVDFVELDGPTVTLKLKGRFWHKRVTVLERVRSYLMQRIPEVIDVTVADERDLLEQ